MVTDEEAKRIEHELNIALGNQNKELRDRVKNLEAIENTHRKLNSELRKEVYELKLKAAKADEYKITIDQMKSIISDLTRDNNRMRNNEKNTTEILQEFRNKGDV
tara:strand:- start:741 stop:1055 length:315 start_codon:yes stop_codon:yes gene_type:complete